MAKQIKAMRDGFRRCGVAHSKAPVVHEDETFSAEQWGVLNAEPMLIISDVPAAQEPGKASKTPAAKKAPVKEVANKPATTEGKPDEKT